MTIDETKFTLAISFYRRDDDDTLLHDFARRNIILITLSAATASLIPHTSTPLLI
jgi:hypothetical protein